MARDRELPAPVRASLRSVGRQLSEARRAYENARHTAAADLPLDTEGRARIVCRRDAERRAVRLAANGRPECYESGHPDCRGCVEDIRSGAIETW